MKPHHSKVACNTPIGFLKTQDRQSLDAGPKRDRHARTPPSAFPFLHITMSKSQWKSSRNHTPEPPMEAEPPLGVNDSGGASGSREPGGNPASVRWVAQPCIIPPEVGTFCAGQVFRVCPHECQWGKRFLGRFCFSPVRDFKATFLPEYGVSLNGQTAW